MAADITLLGKNEGVLSKKGKSKRDLNAGRTKVERKTEQFFETTEARKLNEFNVATLLCMVIVGMGRKLFANAEEGLKANLGSLVLMAALKKVKQEEDESEESEKVAKKTQKHYDTVAAATKKESARVAAFPVPPYERIYPSMGLSLLNDSALCGYIQDKIVRIDAAIQFDLCNPATTVSQGLIDSLWPLAMKKSVDINSEQRGNMGLWRTQLIQNFSETVSSVANLSNGNMGVFKLSGIATKKKGTPDNEKCDAPVFKLSGKKGPGNVQASCKSDPRATKGYICYYGQGAYDKATWNSKPGGCRITITGLTEGEDYNFILIAINRLGEGYWPRPQTMSVPKTL